MKTPYFKVQHNNEEKVRPSVSNGGESNNFIKKEYTEIYKDRADLATFYTTHLPKVT